MAGITYPKMWDSLLRLDKLIRNKDTGTPAEIARKLHIAERTVYAYIQFLRNVMGASIVYHRTAKSYKYREDPGKFIVGYYKSENI